MILPPVWVRVLCWVGFPAGSVTAVLGLVGLAIRVPAEGGAVGLVLLGVIVAVPGWVGARARVWCDRDGVRVRMIRTRVVPVGEIGSVEVRPVYRARSGPSGMLMVIRRDRSGVRLQPTLTERYTPADVNARLEPLAKRMRAVLGLQDPMHLR